MSIQVGFIGCGQIGGSLLLRARERFPQAKLWVHDREESRAEIEASGAVDAWGSVGEVAASADIVVIATPLSLATTMLREVLDRVGEETVVTDVMSVKRPMHEAARGHLREGRYVGGHPMFGSEGSGFAAANAAWVEDAPFILTRTKQTEESASIRAKDFVLTLGARAIDRDPELHDRHLAMVSHLPQALASVLAGFVDPAALEVHGPGFRDMTRLALSAPSFWAEAFRENADVLRPLIDRYAHRLLAFSRELDELTLIDGREAKRRTPRLEQGTFASRVSESSTGAMLRKVVALEAQGKPVIGMHVGEPKLGASAEVLALVREAFARAPIVYTPTAGASDLRERIADIASQVIGRDVATEETLVTVGAKQALHLALGCIVAPGDEVLVISPAWGSFVETVRLAGGKPVMVHADAAEIADSIGPRTRAIIVNSPNNPTGAVYSRALLRAMLEPCAAAGLWLLSDELYRAYVWEGAHVSAASLYDETRSVWLDGVAKSHAMTGLRVGYAVAPRSLVLKMVKLASHETSCASSVAQAAACALLAAHPHGDERLIAQIGELRGRVQRALGKHLATPMAGAFYAWVKAGPNARRLSDTFLEQDHVATMFGDAFFAPGYLRLAYAIDAAELTTALGHIRRRLSA